MAAYTSATTEMDVPRTRPMTAPTEGDASGVAPRADADEMGINDAEVGRKLMERDVENVVGYGVPEYSEESVDVDKEEAAAACISPRVDDGKVVLREDVDGETKTSTVDVRWITSA